MELQQPKDITTLGGKLRVKTRQETAKLLFHFRISPIVFAAGSEILAFIRDISVTASIWRNGSKVTMYQDVSMMTLQEFQTAGEGVIPISQASDNWVHFSLCVDLGVGGAVDIDGESEFDVLLDGIAGFAGTVAVHSLTGALVSTMVPEVVSIYAQPANRTERIELSTFEALAIPLTGFDRITIHHTNARDEELHPLDLLYIQGNTNDLIIASDTGTSFFGVPQFAVDHCVIDVTTATAITVQKAEGVSFRLEALRSVPVSDGRKAAAANSKLVPAV